MGGEAERRITFPRGLIFAALLRPALGNLILAMRGEAGRNLEFLEESRGRDAAAWNRHVGEQSVNWGILTIVLCTAESLVASTVFKTPWLAGSLGNLLPVSAVPMAAGIAGILTCYRNRRSIKCSSRADAARASGGTALDKEQWIWTCLVVPILVYLLPGVFR